jgi:hypothetical protein
MRRFNTFAIAGLAALGLTTAACERRSPTADTQGRGYVETRDPSVASETRTETTTTTETETDLDRQPVAGTETTTPMPSDTAAAPSTAPSTGMVAHDSDTAAGAGDIHWVSEDGERTTISDSTLVTRIQQKLKAEGVYDGPTDGRASAETTAALREYQAKRGLPQTGSIDERTASALELEWDKMKVSGSTAGERLDTAGSEMKEGAKELGRDLKGEAHKAGENIEEGAKDVRDFVDDKTTR